MFSYFTYQMPIGPLTIWADETALYGCSFGTRSPKGTFQETPLLKKAATQLSAYFAGKIRAFDVPLNPQGTPFQQQVWQALRYIPYGQTASYKEIARQIQNPKACRAVGMANNRNPLALFIPCHRVIGCSGKLVGYVGGLGIKKALLALEQDFKNQPANKR